MAAEGVDDDLDVDVDVNVDAKDEEEGAAGVLPLSVLLASPWLELLSRPALEVLGKGGSGSKSSCPSLSPSSLTSSTAVMQTSPSLSPP